MLAVSERTPNRDPSLDQIKLEVRAIFDRQYPGSAPKKSTESPPISLIPTTVEGQLGVTLNKPRIAAENLIQTFVDNNQGQLVNLAALAVSNSDVTYSTLVRIYHKKRQERDWPELANKRYSPPKPAPDSPRLGTISITNQTTESKSVKTFPAWYGVAKHLRVKHGLTYKEIAESLEMNLNTVANALEHINRNPERGFREPTHEVSLSVVKKLLVLKSSEKPIEHSDEPLPHYASIILKASMMANLGAPIDAIAEELEISVSSVLAAIETRKFLNPGRSLPPEEV